MVSKLQEEIQQIAPFRSLKEEAFLNLSRSAAVLEHQLEQTLRPHGLSPTQYNVLRILRGARRQLAEGAEDPGLGQKEIRDRLVAQVPDVPRILERMERAGWLTRTRGSSDRRTTLARITESGMTLLGGIDCKVEAWMNGKLGEIPENEIARFSELLTMARR